MRWCALLAAAPFLLIACGGDEDPVTVTERTVIQTVTVGSGEPPSTNTSTTNTTSTTKTPPKPDPNAAQVTGATALREARTVASQTAARGGISIPPADWEAQCTPQGGGGGRAPAWSCQLVGNAGQCQGTLLVVAPPNGGVATRNNRIGCAE